MSLSVDTSILVYALNEDSDVHEQARSFLESLAARTDVVIAELTLVELYLLIRNPTVFPNPYPAPQAVGTVTEPADVKQHSVFPRMYLHAQSTFLSKPGLSVLLSPAGEVVRTRRHLPHRRPRRGPALPV